MYEKIRRYFVEDLWNFPLSTTAGRHWFFLKSLRVPALAFRSFFQGQCKLYASSLTPFERALESFRVQIDASPANKSLYPNDRLI